MNDTIERKFDLGDFSQIIEEPEQVEETDNNVISDERFNDFITIMPGNITHEGCELILEQHHNLPYSSVVEDENKQNSFIPVDVKEGLSYKYEHECGIDYSVIEHNTKEFKNVIQVFESIIPDHPDFECINYMMIAHYKQDTFFPPHRDIADSGDTATMMLLLNDDYRGGRINVSGNMIEGTHGTCVMFNNSTQVWHSVEPIYEGDRYVLLVWFGRENGLD